MSGEATWQCLGWSGFLSNRRDLETALGVPRDRPIGDLLSSLHERYGLDAAARVEGALAWVAWDGRGRRLVVVRDRLGTQPIVFATHGRLIAFADRVAPIRETFGSLAPNLAALAQHIHGQPPEAGETYFEGVSAVQPAELLVVSSDSIGRQVYWEIDTTLPSLSESQAVDIVSATLDRVVSETVPCEGFALTLSSGIDSTSLAAALRGRQVVAVTWGMPDLPEGDETAIARLVTRRLGLEHEVIRADRHWPLSGEDGVRTVEDSPFIFAYRELWEVTYTLVRDRGLSGLLTGADGDAQFGYAGLGAYGYPDLLLTGRWGELFRQLRAHHRVSPATAWKILAVDLVRPLLLAYLPGAFRRSTRPVPWIAERWRRHGNRRLHASPPGFRMLPGRRYRIEVLRRPHLRSVLEAMTRDAAVYGVEVRHPFLDHRLVEIASRLQGTSTFRAGFHKAVLRDAMRGRLPDEVVNKRQKTVPASLFHLGLRDREQGKVWPLLTRMRAADLGIVDEAQLRAGYSRYLAGDDDAMFWYALTLEDWLRRYF